MKQEASLLVGVLQSKYRDGNLNVMKTTWEWNANTSAVLLKTIYNNEWNTSKNKLDELFPLGIEYRICI